MELSHPTSDPARRFRLSQLGRCESSGGEELLYATVEEGAEESWSEVVDGGEEVESSKFGRTGDEG